jgi:hypothetical protein
VGAALTAAAYDEYRIGGTSLSSPLFAGVMALADQAAGTPRYDDVTGRGTPNGPAFLDALG